MNQKLTKKYLEALNRLDEVSLGMEIGCYHPRYTDVSSEFYVLAINEILDVTIPMQVVKDGSIEDIQMAILKSYNQALYSYMNNR